MSDNLLMSELRRLHEALRQEEKGLKPEEKRAKHMTMVEHCRQIMVFCDIARKEGLLALEEAAWSLPESPAESFDRELIMLIADGTYPEAVERVALAKYYSTEQSIIQAINNIISIYGILSIQAGENPRIIQQMIKNMLPDDVSELEDEEFYPHTEEKQIEEINIDDYCIGEIRLQTKDEGYSEVYLCDKILLALDHRSIQRVLRDVGDDDLATVMSVLSGAGRRRIFDNLSDRNARWLAKSLRRDNPDDKEFYHLHNEWQLKGIKNATVRFLSVINHLEMTAEIVVSANNEVRLLNFILEHISAEEKMRKSKEAEWGRFMRILEEYMKNTW